MKIKVARDSFVRRNMVFWEVHKKGLGELQIDGQTDGVPFMFWAMVSLLLTFGALTIVGAIIATFNFLLGIVILAAPLGVLVFDGTLSSTHVVTVFMNQCHIPLPTHSYALSSLVFMIGSMVIPSIWGFCFGVYKLLSRINLYVVE